MQTTTNLANFSPEEIEEAKRTFEAWCGGGLPDEFDPNDIMIMLNQETGNVLLTNGELQECMLDGKRLEIFYSCANCGNEGFMDEIGYDEENQNCNECK